MRKIDRFNKILTPRRTFPEVYPEKVCDKDVKRVMVVFGTRPEAIKLAPVIKELKKKRHLLVPIICTTGQHREILEQVLTLFEIEPDYNLDVMVHNQDLFSTTSLALEKLKVVLQEASPDLVIVQGDTLTTFVASLAAYYKKILIAHVEAGLRTDDKYNPFPEEIYRSLVARLADFHFAPTFKAKENLIKEGIHEERIEVTGNTGVDALMDVLRRQTDLDYNMEMKCYFKGTWGFDLGIGSSRVIVVTAHRRENFGEGLENICMALREIAAQNHDVRIVCMVHPNPNVRGKVSEMLGNGSSSADNLYLIDPLDYGPFVYLLSKAYLILTDSGGIQEEAPYLGKPVLVMRNSTERSEGVFSGNAKVIGTNAGDIIKWAQILLNEEEIYKKMSFRASPYGEGIAARTIVDFIARALPVKNSFTSLVTL